MFHNSKMSSDLVRQALAFVDPEETNNTKQNMRRNRSKTQNNLEVSHLFKHKSKKKKKDTSILKKDIVEDNIKKLLALSAPTAVGTVDKIIERAIKGKPLAEKFEVKVEEEKSILFPEETFKDFEKSYFCS